MDIHALEPFVGIIYIDIPALNSQAVIRMNAVIARRDGYLTAGNRNLIITVNAVIRGFNCD